jgi:hypothetical protein
MEEERADLVMWVLYNNNSNSNNINNSNIAKRNLTDFGENLVKEFKKLFFFVKDG